MLAVLFTRYTLLALLRISTTTTTLYRPSVALPSKCQGKVPLHYLLLHLLAQILDVANTWQHNVVDDCVVCSDRHVKSAYASSALLKKDQHAKETPHQERKWMCDAFYQVGSPFSISLP